MKKWLLFLLFCVFLAIKADALDVKGNLTVTGKATIGYLSEMDNDDTTLYVADHQLVPKVYVDWKAHAAAIGVYPGSYPIVEGDLLDEAVTSLKIKNLTIVDGDISNSAAINALKIGGGLIDNTEFSFLNGATANFQGQIDGLATDTDIDNMATQLRAEMATDTELATKEPTITPGTTLQYWRGDKSWQTLPVGGASAFSDLTDVDTYAGHGGEYVKVKAGADGLEYGTPAGVGLSGKTWDDFN
jgi:hypothetical protein